MPSRAAVVLLGALGFGCAPSGEPSATNSTPAAGPVISISEQPPQADLISDGRSGAAGDLDSVLHGGRLRVLVAPSRTHFDNVKDGVRGKTVDTAIALAGELTRRAGRRISVEFVVTREHELVPDLLAKRGDVAANVLLTFERDEQVSFATPIVTGVREWIVTTAERPLVSLEDVGGRTIHVRSDSDHHRSLLRLNLQLKAINRPAAKIVVDSKTATDEELLSAVDDGRIPATIVDHYIFERWQPQVPRAAVNRDVAVSQDGVLAWVTRKDTPKLLALLNEFFSTHRLIF